MREIRAKDRNGNTVKMKGLLFSGVRDTETGKEICEGDILEVTEIYKDSQVTYTTGVIFEDATFLLQDDKDIKEGRGYYSVPLASWSGDPKTTRPNFTTKIVGNIQDDIKLLEVSE